MFSLYVVSVQFSSTGVSSGYQTVTGVPAAYWAARNDLNAVAFAVVLITNQIDLFVVVELAPIPLFGIA